MILRRIHFSVSKPLLLLCFLGSVGLTSSVAQEEVQNAQASNSASTWSWRPLHLLEVLSKTVGSKLFGMQGCADENQAIRFHNESIQQQKPFQDQEKQLFTNADQVLTEDSPKDPSDLPGENYLRASKYYANYPSSTQKGEEGPCPHPDFLKKHVCTTCKTGEDCLVFSRKRNRRATANKNTVLLQEPNFKLDKRYARESCRNIDPVKIMTCTLNTGFCKIEGEQCYTRHATSNGHLFYREVKCNK